MFLHFSFRTHKLWSPQWSSPYDINLIWKPDAAHRHNISTLTICLVSKSIFYMNTTFLYRITQLNVLRPFLFSFLISLCLTAFYRIFQKFVPHWTLCWLLQYHNCKKCAKVFKPSLIIQVIFKKFGCWFS